MTNKKSFRKYAVTTMAAATATAAIVPAAVSADTQDGNFPDVSDTNVHKDAIEQLAGEGVIQGFADGMFRPYESVTRSQVAVMLAEKLGLDTPNDVESALEGYTDVDADHRYAAQIAAVTEASIFAGNDGEFNPYDNISRQQMATVLVEGFNLAEYNTDEDVKIEMNKVSASHKNNVQILANLGITNQLGDEDDNNFKGYNNIQRGQFSTFVVNASEVTEEDVEVAYKGTDVDEESITEGVTYADDKFTVPERVTTFTFTDDGAEFTATYENNDWIFSQEASDIGPSTTVITATSDEVINGKFTINLDEVDVTASVATDVVEDGDNNVKITFDDKGLDISNLKEEFDFEIDDVTYTAVKDDNAWTINVVQDFEIESLEPIEVYSGTSSDDVQLPETVQVTYDNDEVENIEVTWDTSDLDLNKPGEYTLTGELSNISATASLKIIVQKEYPDSVKIEETDSTIKEDESIQLNAKISPESSIKKDLTWSSSDNSVVAVDQNGKVTGVSEGTATITVSTENGNEATVNVTVDNKPALFTNAYGSININGVLKSIDMQINNLDNVDVTVEKVEVYEKDRLATTYEKDELESSGIETLIKPEESWGMSISYKLGIFEEGSYVKFHIKSKDNIYQFVEKLDD